MAKTKSFTPGGGAVKFAEQKFQKNALGVGVPGTLREAVGTKGKPLSIRQSYEKANPYFSKEYAEYSSNCQRCVVANEFRRRGYDVMALPTYKGDKKPRVAFSAKDGTVNGHWMGAFKGAKAEYVGNRSSEKVVGNIKSKMRSYGRGSRGVVQVFWKNGGGHVFNVENVGGKIKAFDAQTGKSVSLSDYIGKASGSSVNLIRTDNLRISNRAREFVTKSRR